MSPKQLVAATALGAGLYMATLAGAQVVGGYWLMVPPEFVGQPAVGSTPNRNWISIGTYATQADCDAARQSSSMEFFSTQVGTSGQTPVQHTAPKLPTNAACVPENSFDGDNTVTVPTQ